jgi:ABC-type multidrug transport system ATPase subunit
MVLGHDLSLDRRSVRLLVGYLGHETFLYEELTVEENLRFALRASGSGAPEAARQADAAMARLGLVGRLANTPVGKLSAGQRRRTAIAVVVGRRPRLWLLDEPHAGLDAEARALLDEIVVEARAGGATLVLSSHELAASGGSPLADRVVHLAGGRVVNAPVGGSELAARDTADGSEGAGQVGPQETASPEQPFGRRKTVTAHVA